MKNTKSAVLACVTSQYNCDRIIRIAKEIADSSDCELRVMSVLKPMSDYSSVSDEIEYLYLIAKESGADMTVMFSDDAPTCCFSVGHFHIYLPLAGYICRWQTMFATQAISLFRRL